MISSADRTAVVLASNAHRISDLFAPNDPEVRRFGGLVLWIIDAQSAGLWRRRPEALLDAVRRISESRPDGASMWQIALLTFAFLGMQRRVRLGETRARLVVPSGMWELADLLSDAGVTVAAVPEDELYYLDVRRPDATIGVLRREPLPKRADDPKAAGAGDSLDFVDRAPRLRRLTLACHTPGEETSRRLFEELLSREIPLLLMCDRERRVSLVSWEGVSSAFPAYPDLRSLVQAATETR